MPFLPFYVGYETMPQRLVDQDFGLAMTANDLLMPPLNPTMMPREYYRPWRWNANQMYNQVGSTIKTDKTKLVINLDVQHFAPEEISVKTVDGFVIIEAKHEEKKDEHGYIARHFIRRYALPQGTNPDLVESKLSSDGVLTIIAPRSAPEAKNERAVPIAQTGPIRKNVHDQASVNSANGSEK